MAPRKKRNQNIEESVDPAAIVPKLKGKRGKAKVAPKRKQTVRKPAARKSNKTTKLGTAPKNELEPNGSSKDTNNEEICPILEKKEELSEEVPNEALQKQDHTSEITAQLEHLAVHQEEVVSFDAKDTVSTLKSENQVDDILETEQESDNIKEIPDAECNKFSNKSLDDIDEIKNTLSNIKVTEDILTLNQTDEVCVGIQKVKCENVDNENGELNENPTIESIPEEVVDDPVQNVKEEETQPENLANTISELSDIKETNSNETNITELEIKEEIDILEDIAKKLDQIEKNKIKKKTEKPKKETKKKEKSAKNSKKTGKSDDSSLIRRSNRLKSINVSRKPSVGHGLVKYRDCDNSDGKNETETIHSPQISQNANEFTEKPIKVKSRWRRSSELEMNVSNAATVLNANLKLSENSESSNECDKANVLDELVESRLKQFNHLKENLYLTDRFICKEAKKMTCDCFLTEDETTRGEMACGEDCLNRLLMIECGSLCQVGDRCANKKFHKGQFAPVEVFNTHKKGLGLRAAANIPYGEFILEYVGEVINADEFDKRAEEYSKDKNQHYYFMSLRSDAVIDATQKGNISRFINHSCEPNAETQKWTVNGELRIGFFSTRTILAGEEITFDYKFERYGKEAQKCFCETPTCRGWLGEEPEDEEEEDEEETLDEKTESSEIKEDGVSNREKQVIKEVRKVVKRKPRRKLGKELLFEDDQLDAEIEMLVTTGLKNQAHTLKLSRLMLRAKEPIQRSKLLKVLRRGELPCRRLFLDYHGLRLMQAYMTDALHLCKSDKKHDSLRLEMLQTLAVLPIPNKTMLQDSKVLSTVEKWSVPLSASSPMDSESSSPKIEIESPVPTTLTQMEKSSIEDKNDLIRKSVGMNENNADSDSFMNNSGSALAEEIVNIFEDETSTVKQTKPVLAEIKPQLPNYDEEISSLASKLLEAWLNLKEVYRIPKKERIEQMKEHEREANKGYIAGLGLEQYAEKRNENRYRGMQRSLRQQDNKKTFKPEERSMYQGMLDKHNRRKLFALQVEQQEEERRRKQRELWTQHERNCMLIGTDPRFTAPFDPTRGFQCIWNQRIGQWQNYPLPSNSLGYGHLTGQGSLPNTNIPPPNINAPSNFPFPVPHLQVPGGLTPLSSGRNSANMVSPTTSLSHQTLPCVPPVNTNMPPPPSNMSQSMYPTTGYPSKLIVGQPPTVFQQEKKPEVISMIGDVKFLGPIPPPPKLPPKWKCAKDKYGRPYYYHVRIRKSQWVPPPLETADESESSTSESSLSSSESSSEDSDSEEDIINDSRLLRQVKKQMDKQFKTKTATRKQIIKNDEKISPIPEVKEEVEISQSIQPDESELETSIDKRLKEQFNLIEGEAPQTKKKRSSLVQEIIISPRTEEDKIQFREERKRYKENKETLKKQKEMILQQNKKHAKEKKQKQQLSKAKLREMKYSNSENAKKIKESFRSSMANTVVTALNAYRKTDCKEGRITNTEDFKHLARKLTHFVMLKEMKHISEIEELTCSDNVKAKARDYIRKYMSKFGDVYVKRDDEPDHYY